MLYDGLQLDACLRLLGLEIQRVGKLIIWFSANLESGIQRWAAVYEYEGGYYAQSTDSGQTGPYTGVSDAFARTISDIDMSSLEIGGVSMSPQEFIELLREELRDAKYEIPGLDSQRIEAVANKMPSSDHAEEKAPVVPTFDEFLYHRETANATGSIFQLWPGEDPKEWKGNFLELLKAKGREVYSQSWDSGGMCSNGVEYIEEFLGQYWAAKSIEGTSGPYESFADVFDDEYFRGVGSATESIWCCEMTTEELLSKLILDEEYLEPGFTIKINDNTYVLTEDFRLIPAQ
jgi:hypothetical protein